MRQEAPDKNRPSLPQRLWRSVFSGPVVPRDDYERRWIVRNHLLLHFRPVRIPEKTMRFTHTWGLGGMALVLILLLAFTGTLLMFVYEPAPGLAHESLRRLQNEVMFGTLVRNVHYWSANLLMVVATLHLLRVFLTGGFHAPRQLNWIIGLLLLGSIATSNLTGYLLPWDQLSYWATTIVTGMVAYLPLVGDALQATIRGGPDVGPATLINFYAVHTTVVPVVLIVLMAFHFWRVRRSGGVVVPRSVDETVEGTADSVSGRTVPSWPNLLLRELVVAQVLIALVLALSLLFDAPLGEAANPGMSPNPAKAPWYFAGFQELLLHVHPVVAVLVVPAAASIGLCLLPYLRYDRNTAGVLMVSRSGRRIGLWAAVVTGGVTPLWIVADELWIDPAVWLPWLPPILSGGLLPLALMVVVVSSVIAGLRARYHAAAAETVQAVFLVAAVAFLVLTVTGVWFRGSGMALVWPWGG